MSAMPPEDATSDQRYVDPVIEAYKKDVDRSLIRHMLGLSVEERLLSLERSLQDLADIRRASMNTSGR